MGIVRLELQFNTKWWQEQNELPYKKGLHPKKQVTRIFVQDIGSKLLHPVSIWRN